jgi:hypothetical protein
VAAQVEGAKKMNQHTTKIWQAEKRVEAVRDLKRSFYNYAWDRSLPQKDAAVECQRRKRIAWLIDAIIEEVEDMHRLAVIVNRRSESVV